MNTENKFTMIRNDFIERMNELSGSAFKVCVAIAKHAPWGTEWGSKEASAYPSIQTIIKITGLGKSTVHSALYELIEKGWLVEIETRYNNSNVYILGDGRGSNSELLEARKEKGKRYIRKSRGSKTELVCSVFELVCSKTEPLEVQNLNTNYIQLNKNQLNKRHLNNKEENLENVSQESISLENDNDLPVLSVTNVPSEQAAPIGALDNNDFIESKEACNDFSDKEYEIAGEGSQPSNIDKQVENSVFKFIDLIDPRFLADEYKTNETKAIQNEVCLQPDNYGQQLFLAKYVLKEFKSEKDKRAFEAMQKAVPGEGLGIVFPDSYEKGIETAILFTPARYRI